MKTKVFLFIAIMALLTSCKEDSVINPYKPNSQTPTGTSITYVNNTEYRVDIFNDGELVTTLAGMGSQKEYISTQQPISIVVTIYKSNKSKQQYSINSYKFSPNYNYRLDITWNKITMSYY